MTLLAVASLTFFSASALNITLTPGEISTKLPELVNTQDKSVKISGKADVRDLIMLKQLSKTVESLDMTDLDIAAYTYKDGDYMGTKVFAAGELPPYMLAGSGISAVNLPKTLRIVGEGAFMASAIKEIEFPASVTKIGDFAFANADALKSARLQSNATLGIGVFKDCDVLTHVVMDKNVQEIPQSMFDGCFSFSDELPASVTKVGDYAYRGTAVKSLDLTNLSKIGNYAFADMKNLESVKMNNHQDIEMGTGAFLNDLLIAYLPTFDSDVTTASFSHTGGQLTATIHSENIGEAAYANNKTLDTIYLGSKVKYIGAHAFRNDTNLKLVDVSSLGTTTPEVDPDAFSGLLNEEGRYDIDLNIDNVENAKEWSKHPVWGLFNIGHFTDGLDNIMAEGNADITVYRTGTSIYATSTLPIDYIGVFNLNGLVLGESKTAGTEIQLTDLPETDVMIVKVVSGGVTKIVKLI